MSAPELAASLQRVHMVGIGGAGMSGIARILLASGGQVSGTDAKDSRTLTALSARGATVQVGHAASALDLLPGGPTTVITSFAAIPADNPELVEARRRGIPVLMRSEVLAQLMEGHRRILVAGTHGKTSTTSMLVVALQHAGLDPSFAVGGDLGEAGTNAHRGSGDVFVAEADESDGSLLRYTPDVAVVTNVEADHLDYFGTEDAYHRVFDEFAERIVDGGLLVVCLDDPGAAALGARVHAGGRVRVLGYRSADADGTVPVGVTMLEYAASATGGRLLVSVAGESQLRRIELGVPGRHMALNALGAFLAARDVAVTESDPNEPPPAPGMVVDELLAGLAGFGGVRRRFQYLGRQGGVRVFDDYAHHPTEVRAVLTAARQLVPAAGDGRVVVVFQPHLYSRTQQFAGEFADALDLADELVVLDVYPAREAPIPGVSGALVAAATTVPTQYQPDLSEAARQVASLARPGDVVITMGAGDVTMLGTEILGLLSARRLPPAP